MLVDSPPDLEFKHVLHTHNAANKVVFLQGSAFSKQVRGLLAVVAAIWPMHVLIGCMLSVR